MMSVASCLMSGEKKTWEGTLTFRVFGQHGVALRYFVSQRDAHYPQRGVPQPDGRNHQLYVCLAGKLWIRRGRMALNSFTQAVS